MSTPDTLSAWTLAAMVEAELIGAEAAAGVSHLAARRPLTGWERRSRVRFGDIDEEITETLDRGRPWLAAVFAAGAAALITTIFGASSEVTPGEANSRADLAADAVVAGAVAGTAVLVLDALSDLWRKGHRTVAEELSAQGVDTTGWLAPPPPPTLAPLAETIATHPVLRQLEVVSRYVNDPARTLSQRVSREQLEGLLTEVSQRSAADLFRQGLHSTFSLGRLASAELNRPAALIFASEVLDRSTCSACRAVDGRRYDTLAQAQADYGSGTYRDCAGGSRCRGLVFFVALPDGVAPVDADSSG